MVFYVRTWVPVLVALLWAIPVFVQAQDADKIRRQLDRLNKALAETSQIPPNTEATLETLRRELFRSALETRDAKKRSDAIAESMKTGQADPVAELEALRGDIIAAGTRLRELRDRIERFSAIIEDQKRLLQDQASQIEKLDRALLQQPGMLEDAVARKTRALEKTIASLNEQLAARDAAIARLDVKPSTRATPPPPAVAAAVVDTTPALTVAFDALASGRIDEALSGFQGVLAVDPASLDARAGLAAGFFEQGQFAAANELVEQVLEVERKHARALGLRGALLFREGKAKDARKALERAVDVDDTNPFNYNQLGVVLSGLGRNRDAIKALQRAVELDPEYVTAMVNLAILLASDKEPDLEFARYYYVKALSKGSARQPFLDDVLGLGDSVETP
ncbi:MAG TPA: tetratricopeptide repeat protein [Kiritimatiellia bacterium]|nr:tetratricopeptide repeat protein [Kiritimatiellia bacterium]HMP33103.1 tetratricopeptide repeat protein [Kiritimatiellia bacterium]